MASIDPKYKADRTNTYHKDGSVSYWNVFLQQWCRDRVDQIPDRVLASMSDDDRAKVARHAMRTFGWDLTVEPAWDAYRVLPDGLEIEC